MTARFRRRSAGWVSRARRTSGNDRPARPSEPILRKLRRLIPSHRRTPRPWISSMACIPHRMVTQAIYPTAHLERIIIGEESRSPVWGAPFANERERARAQKRGGGRTLVSLDFPSATERYRQEPASGETADVYQT